MSPRKKKITLGQMIIEGGWRNTRVALRYASRVGLAAEALGHVPSLEEYQSFHGLSQAQAYRDSAAWRKCVPGYSVVEVVSDDALRSRGLSEEDRESRIAQELAE